MSVQNPSEPGSYKQVLKTIPASQKIAIIVLVLAAVLIVVFWALQFRAQLLNPLGLGGKEIKETAVAIIDPQTIDTDKDGLFDYEEINYKTSPYLEDTDSDGINDKQEIEDGTDPTCPQGKNCAVATENLTGSSTSNQIQNNLTPSINLATSTITTNEEAALQGILSGGADAATLRQILISSGVDKTELDKISDEDLMKSYQETLDKQNTQ
jgi:hypothetical protein